MHLDNLDIYYDGDDLGVTYSKEKSIFKLWSPFANQVELALYTDAGEYDESGVVISHSDGKEIPMELKNDGVWQIEINEDLEGYYYMYKVTLPEHYIDNSVDPYLTSNCNYAIDPYARAVSCNGQRGYIIDLNETNPAIWTPNKQKPAFNSPTDAIIYEMHVRDFSISEDSGIKNKGRYLGLTEEETRYKETAIKTGLDHLIELGVTHVQLMPIYDYQTVDERKFSPDSYNWGYDPLNYNVPEGSYASDILDPTKRIIELKQVIQKLHDSGIRVIMDVVYNHTYSISEGPFEKIVPGYFYRKDELGLYTDGSGTGNEIASEHPMVRKYIIDSLKYWVKEYSIDGFRFDLMGLIDIDTVEEIVKELHDIDPNLLILGEPWQAGGSVLSESKQTIKGSQKGKGFAVFNDHFRNAIKGGSDDDSKGFATGEFNNESLIVRGVEGAFMDFTEMPSESINYVIAHDNLNLWDKVITTQGLEEEEGFLELRNGLLIKKSAEKFINLNEAIANATPYHGIQDDRVFENETVRRSILANGIILTSQGIPFLHAGDEFLRTKFGDHNSYKSSDLINKIRWQNKARFIDVFNYYKGLIELRKKHPAFRMNDADLIRKHLKVWKCDENIVSFELRANANDDDWESILVIYNANVDSFEYHMPNNDIWHQVVDDNKSGTTILRDITKSDIYIPGLSMAVFYQN